MKTLTKEERLSSKILIDKLVQSGKSFNSFPFRIIWIEVTENNVPAQIVISIPKRIFKRAIDRNKLKRLTREAYRKNKSILIDNLNNKKIHLLFVYSSKKVIESKEMEEKLVSVLQLLSKKINN